MLLLQLKLRQSLFIWHFESFGARTILKFQGSVGQIVKYPDYNTCGRKVTSLERIPFEFILQELPFYRISSLSLSSNLYWTHSRCSKRFPFNLKFNLFDCLLPLLKLAKTFFPSIWILLSNNIWRQCHKNKSSIKKSRN